MDPISVVWLTEESGRVSRFGLQQRHEVPSSHQAARAQSRRRSLQVSNQNDLDDGATCSGIIAAWGVRGLIGTGGLRPSFRRAIVWLRLEHVRNFNQMGNASPRSSL